MRIQWVVGSLVTLMIAGGTFSSYYARISDYVVDDTAVLIADDLTVRAGDGDEFREIAELSTAEGTVVEVLDERGGWLKIALADGRTGWVQSHMSARI